jgi:hypothetical protein
MEATALLPITPFHLTTNPPASIIHLIEKRFFREIGQAFPGPRWRKERRR